MSKNPPHKSNSSENGENFGVHWMPVKLTRARVKLRPIKNENLIMDSVDWASLTLGDLQDLCCVVNFRVAVAC